jgi:hypothetical protein
MLNSETHWNIQEKYRESISLIIIFSLGYSLITNFFDKGNYFANIENSYSQIYFIFVVPAIIFAVGLWFNKFHTWIYSIGITSIPIGATISIERVSVYLGPNNHPDALKWALTTVFPFLLILFSLVVVTLKQKIESGSNFRIERVSAIIGFVLSILLLWGEFLPWVRTVYKSTSANWKFNGSGTQTLIEECCYMTSFPGVDLVKIILPILFLAILFLIRVLGYTVPNLMFSGSLVWCFQEGIDFLTGLGAQPSESNANWTVEDIATYGLSLETQGMFGGYLFVFAFLGVLVALLLPRVLTGRQLSENH